MLGEATPPKEGKLMIIAKAVFNKNANTEEIAKTLEKFINELEKQLLQGLHPLNRLQAVPNGDNVILIQALK